MAPAQEDGWSLGPVYTCCRNSEVCVGPARAADMIRWMGPVRCWPCVRITLVIADRHGNKLRGSLSVPTTYLLKLGSFMQ